MPLHRFFVTPPLRAGELTLSADESRHLRDVFRGEVGDHIVVFDGAGASADAVIQLVDRQAIRIRVEGTPGVEPRPSPRIELWCGLPRAGGADDTLRAAIEAGVDIVRPLLARRGVWRPDQAGDGERLAGRFARIAIASSKQCGRSWLPTLGEPVGCEGPLFGPGTLAVFGQTGAGAQPLLNVLGSGRAAGVSTVVLVVGPEGGLDAAEEQALAARGAIGVTCGQSILRVGTAAVVLVSHAVTFFR